jgi:phosphoribosylformimino-5-aminoimidazole carboxamide ribotide isomerase
MRLVSAEARSRVMRVLPVLDLLAGQVVRGVGGRRHEYRPVVSRLTPSCRPLDVAEAFRTRFGLRELYVADLDAIAGAPPALETYAALHAGGFRLWVDGGVRDAATACPLAAAGMEGVIVGLENVAGPAALREVTAELGQRVVFSLDLKDGIPLGDRAAWDAADGRAIAARAVAVGVRRIIVLDLARVGGGVGTGTEDLCRDLVVSYPGVEILAGGGVRGPDDVRRLRDCGVAGVLVASALHDGRLRAQDLPGL